MPSIEAVLNALWPNGIPPNEYAKVVRLAGLDRPLPAPTPPAARTLPTDLREKIANLLNNAARPMSVQDIVTTLGLPMKSKPTVYGVLARHKFPQIVSQVSGSKRKTRLFGAPPAHNTNGVASAPN